MHLKSLAFHLVNRTSAVEHQTLTRSHAYELIAAAFGYQTYASFSQTAVALFDCDEPSNINQPILLNRCQQLHYELTAHLIAQSLQELVKEYSIKVVTLIELTKTSNSIMYQCNKEQLMLSLETQARKNPLANYALGVILMSLVDAADTPHPYWHHQLEMGKTLSHDEDVFAMEYKRYKDKLDKAKQCFSAAAERSCVLGTLGLARYFEDHQFFNQHIEPNDLPFGTYDPMEIAYIAQDMGHDDEYTRWLLDACGHGNVDAIRAAIGELQESNLVFCHALVELSSLLGKDVRQEYFCIVDEHGFEKYDDYGPEYADGYYAVELHEISDKDKTHAQSLAQQWLMEIQQIGRTQCMPSQW